MSDKYILDGHTPILELDTIKWAMFFGGNDRIVAKTQVGDAEVSTVFLGIDHSYGGGAPLLFETMIFGGERDGYQKRYSTWGEAEIGHIEAALLISPQKTPIIITRTGKG